MNHFFVNLNVSHISVFLFIFSYVLSINVYFIIYNFKLQKDVLACRAGETTHHRRACVTIWLLSPFVLPTHTHTSHMRSQRQQREQDRVRNARRHRAGVQCISGNHHNNSVRVDKKENHLRKKRYWIEYKSDIWKCSHLTFQLLGRKFAFTLLFKMIGVFFSRIHHTTQKREFICDLPWISARICQMHIIWIYMKRGFISCFVLRLIFHLTFSCEQ